MDILGFSPSNQPASFGVPTKRGCSICAKYESSGTPESIGAPFVSFARKRKVDVPLTIALIGDESLIKRYINMFVAKHEYDVSTSLLRMDEPSTLNFPLGDDKLTLKVIPAEFLHEEGVFDGVESAVVFFDGAFLPSMMRASHALEHYKNVVKPKAIKNVVAVEIDRDTPNKEALTFMNRFLMAAEPKQHLIMQSDMRLVELPLFHAHRLASAE